jgi:spore coat protein U-like protein
MSLKWMRLLPLAILFVLTAGGAQAATFSCSLGAAPNVNRTYSSAGNTSIARSVTVTCVKAGGGAGLTINYTVTPNNGLNASGAQNRAALGGQFINYDIYTATSCAVPWSGTGSIVMPAGGGATRTQTLTYYGCVPASQPGLPAAGTYNDTVSLQLAVSTGGVTITGTNPRTFQANITVNATCVMATPQGVAQFPGTIAFGTYTAFQVSAKTANTTFITTCTNLTPYTLSLDAASGVVSGLNYSLLLNTSASGGIHPFGPVPGTGSAQTYYINGTMPANQAGSCAGASCAGSNVHTLTVTY